MPDLNTYWILNIAAGVLLGHLAVLALAWLLDRATAWRRRRSRRRGGVRTTIVVAIVMAAAGVFLALKVQDWFGGTEQTLILPTDPAEIEKARVDPTPGLLERIQYGPVTPTRIRVGTEPSEAGKKRVADYCAPAAGPPPVQTSANASDSAVPASPVPRVGPRLLPDFNGRVSGSNAFFSSTLNDGTPWDGTYKARGRWKFRSSGDSVLVDSERFLSRLARSLVRCGAIGAAGAGVGALTDLREPLQGAARGAVIGGGTCAALEIAF